MEHMGSKRKPRETPKTYIVVVAMRTMLISIFVLGKILAESFATLFADESHFDGFAQGVVL